MHTPNEQMPDNRCIEETSIPERFQYVTMVDALRLQPYIYEMEKKIERIEYRLDRIESDVQELKSDMRGIKTDLVNTREEVRQSAHSTQRWIFGATLGSMLGGVALVVAVIAMQNSWYQQTLDRNWETANRALERIDAMQRQNDFNKYEIEHLDRKKTPAAEAGGM